MVTSSEATKPVKQLPAANNLVQALVNQRNLQLHQKQTISSLMKGNPQLMVEKVQQANLVNKKAARFFSPLSYVDGRKGALSPNVRSAKNS